MSKGGKAQTTTTTAPSWQLPYLKDVLGQASGLYYGNDGVPSTGGAATTPNASAQLAARMQQLAALRPGGGTGYNNTAGLWMTSQGGDGQNIPGTNGARNAPATAGGTAATRPTRDTGSR